MMDVCMASIQENQRLRPFTDLQFTFAFLFIVSFVIVQV